MHLIRSDRSDSQPSGRSRKDARTNTMAISTCPIKWITHWLGFQNFQQLFLSHYYCRERSLEVDFHELLCLVSRLMDFFPTKKQTEEYLKSVFVDKGLAEVVKLHKNQASQEAKRELTQVTRPFNSPCLPSALGRHLVRVLVPRWDVRKKTNQSVRKNRFFACIRFCIAKKRMSIRTWQQQST